jgi:hypothetical protein
VIRSAGYVLSLAVRRLGRRDGGALAAALGIAAAAAVLAGILAGATVAKDRSVAQDVDRVPAAARSVRATWFGVPAGPQERWSTFDRAARQALATLPAGSPTAIALVRESTVGGVFAGLAAVEGLRPHVLLRSGRMPRRCTAERCEVLRLRGEGRLPDVPGLRIVQVGTATLRSSQLFGDFLAPTDNALADAELAPALQQSAGYHRPPPGPLVVAEGIEALASSPVLDRTYRSYAWVQPLSAGTPRLWEIDELVERADRARAELQSVSPSWAVSLPSQELRQAQRDATVAGRRLLLVGGEAAALLVAFAVLAAGALRRDLAAARRRLTWHGARGWQRVLLTGAEAAAVGVGGALAGWLVGTVGGAIAARASGAPAWAVLAESVVSATGLLLGLAVAVLAALVIGVTVSLGRRRRAGAGPLELAALAALLAAGAVLASGAVDARELAGGGAAPVVLLALPGLVAFAGAVGASRLLPATGRILARRGGGTSRLAGVSVARSPGAAGVASAFLALAVGLAVLAVSYRATLQTAERDGAAFAVPADVIVRENLRALVPVLRAAPLERYSAIPGVEAVDPVVRVTASAGPAASVSGVTVLGLSQRAIGALPLWRDGWGTSMSGLADALGPRGPTALRGVRLRRPRLQLVVGRGLVAFRATIEQTDGSFRTVEVGTSDPRRPSVVATTLPPPARGGRLVAVTLVPPRLEDRGADAGTALRGATTLRIPGVRLDDWLGEGGVTVSPGEPARDTLRLSYAITQQRTARVRPRQPTDGAPPTVAVTPALGRLAGGVGRTLPLRIGGETIAVRVAAVVDRIPGTLGDAVVGDVGAVSTAIDTRAPGAANVAELWLKVDDARRTSVEATFDRPPFAVLDKQWRATLEADARRDPLGHGTLLALVAAALAALVLAVVGLIVAIRADLRDDRGDLADLEAQGATPALLRRVVSARAGLVAAVGVVVGVGAGLVLSVLVTRVVSVTARADAPEPPLVTSLDPVTLLVGAAAFAAAASTLVALTARRAFDDPRGPGRIGGDA